MKIARWLLPLSLVLAWSVPAFAGKKFDVTLPDSVKVADKTLVLNGMGLREATVFNVDVYVAGLYLESKSSDGAAIMSSRQIKRMHLHFKREVERGDMIKAWKEGFGRSVGKDLSAYKDRLDKISSWMSDVDEGQTMVFTYVPDKGVEVAVKGTVKGVIPGDDFAEIFFGIWLGPKTPYKDLRKGLLGK